MAEQDQQQTDTLQIGEDGIARSNDGKVVGIVVDGEVLTPQSAKDTLAQKERDLQSQLNKRTEEAVNARKYYDEQANRYVQAMQELQAQTQQSRLVPGTTSDDELDPQLAELSKKIDKIDSRINTIINQSSSREAEVEALRVNATMDAMLAKATQDTAQLPKVNEVLETRVMNHIYRKQIEGRTGKDVYPTDDEIKNMSRDLSNYVIPVQKPVYGQTIKKPQGPTALPVEKPKEPNRPNMRDAADKRAGDLSKFLDAKLGG